MGESLTQPCHGGKEGLRIVKHFLSWEEGQKLIPCCFDVTNRISTGQLRASSRGNTKGASVNLNYWA